MGPSESVAAAGRPDALHRAGGMRLGFVRILEHGRVRFATVRLASVRSAHTARVRSWPRVVRSVAGHRIRSARRGSGSFGFQAGPGFGRAHGSEGTAARVGSVRPRRSPGLAWQSLRARVRSDGVRHGCRRPGPIGPGRADDAAPALTMALWPPGCSRGKAAMPPPEGVQCSLLWEFIQSGQPARTLDRRRPHATDPGGDTQAPLRGRSRLHVPRSRR